MLIFYMISVAALVIALAFLGWQVFRGREAADGKEGEIRGK